MSVTKILRKYVRPASLYSAEPVKQQLLADLKKQRDSNSLIYGVVFGVVCAVVLIGIGALLFDLVKGQSFRLHILATAGVGIPFILELMRRVVREWSQMNLLVTLVGHSDESSIQAIIQKLLSSDALYLHASSSAPSSAHSKEHGA